APHRMDMPAKPKSKPKEHAPAFRKESVWFFTDRLSGIGLGYGLANPQRNCLLKNSPVPSRPCAGRIRAYHVREALGSGKPAPLTCATSLFRESINIQTLADGFDVHCMLGALAVVEQEITPWPTT
ncbi:hypothetical protein, partial [Pseudomonas huaxiensis]|uniref:hypothetical protein n=1 Tax=Pseudomonas huaxiensis TaxID=2213017 RepID=UPI001CDC0D90